MKSYFYKMYGEIIRVKEKTDYCGERQDYKLYAKNASYFSERQEIPDELKNHYKLSLISRELYNSFIKISS